MRSGASVWAAGVAVAAAVLSGCTTTVTGTATSAEAASAASGAPASGQPTKRPPDGGQLEATTLQLTDLPGGWSAQPGIGPGQETMRSISACLGARDTWRDVAEVSATSSFDDAGGDAIGAFAASYRSQQDVDDDAALLRDTRAPDCFSRAFADPFGGASAPPGASVDTPVFTVAAGSGGGPSNVAGLGIGTVTVTTVDGRNTTIYIEFVLITGRMTEAQLFFLSRGQPLSAGLLSGAISAVAQRVAAL